MVTYLTAAGQLGYPAAHDQQPKEAISITSNQTYRLNRSPVRKAPQTAPVRSA
jgi:hypothetical protein